MNTTTNIRVLNEEGILTGNQCGCGYTNKEIIRASLVYAFIKNKGSEKDKIIEEFQNDFSLNLQITFNEEVDNEFINECKNQASFY